jgi:hypothetical protein
MFFLYSLESIVYKHSLFVDVMQLSLCAALWHRCGSNQE